VISASAPAGFPPESVPEVAFVGRSNVGKSSLINGLVGVSGLARTSRTPGRTRLLNWFAVDAAPVGAVHFVDLPGYGYAGVDRGTRESWRPLIEDYLGNRKTLRVVVLLIDIRRGVADEELDFVPWLQERKIAIVTVLTKSDKVPKNKRLPIAKQVARELGLKKDPLLVSALDREGFDPLWSAVTAALRPARQ
jgi:GTP-binding protein